MAILKSLKNLLDKNKVKYKIIEHKKTYTAADSAETQKIDPREVVKTLIMKVNPRKYILALIPANRNLNTKKLLDNVNKWLKKEGEKAAKNIEFAKESWMKKNVKGKVGATPPFGILMKMTTFVDKSFLRRKNLIINTGDYQKSIKLPMKKFFEIEDMLKGSFSEAKKSKKKKNKTIKKSGNKKNKVSAVKNKNKKK